LPTKPFGMEYGAINLVICMNERRRNGLHQMNPCPEAFKDSADRQRYRKIALIETLMDSANQARAIRNIAKNKKITCTIFFKNFWNSIESLRILISQPRKRTEHFRNVQNIH
jgi:hypothetical protein